jgi:hypothetical protein
MKASAQALLADAPHTEVIMKGILARAAILVSALFAAGRAQAVELWVPDLPGLDEGLQAGAAPAPGVYAIVNQYYGTLTKFGNSGRSSGYGVDALFEVPELFWYTDYRILGARYSAGIALPFDYSNVFGPAIPPESNEHGLYNTTIVPAQLNWQLPAHLFVKTGLTIRAADATSTSAGPPSTGGIGSGTGYWTVEPDFAVSWLRGGWNLTASMHYMINLSDPDYHIGTGLYNYRSGNIIEGDYTLSKSHRRWTFGVGGYSVNQLTSDSGAGAVLAGCGHSGGCRAESYGVGPLAGYDFGGISALIAYNFPMSQKNDLNGRVLNVRFVIPL